MRRVLMRHCARLRTVLQVRNRIVYDLSVLVCWFNTVPYFKMMEAFNQNEPTEAARIPNERVVALRAVADASERVAAENMVNLCR